jgi:hypothetical protein
MQLLLSTPISPFFYEIFLELIMCVSLEQIAWYEAMNRAILCVDLLTCTGTPINS